MRLLAVVLSSLCLTALSAAADWPQFHRDARRSGDNPTAELTFPLSRITAVRLPAPIYASPAVVGDRVYVQDSLGNFVCVAAAKNQVVWLQPLGGFNNTSSPAVAEGKVFVGSSIGKLFVLDAATGKILEQVPAEGPVLNAPAIANDAVYFSTLNGKLTKIDFQGQVQWSFNGGRLCTSEIAILDRDILFFAGSNTTYLYRLHDEGKSAKVLHKTASPSNCCPMSGPTFFSDKAYAFQSFDSEFGRFYLMKPDGKNQSVGDISDSRIVPAFRGDRIFRGDRCFNTEPTLKQAWRVEAEHLYDGGFHSSPALGKNIQVVGCEMGKVHFVSIEGADKIRKPVFQFATLQAGEPNSAVSSSPAFVDGKVFFGCEDGVLYGLGQGKESAVVVAKGARERTIGKALQGSEWPTPGGDMGYSFVSTDKLVKPPFAPEWKTKIWSVFKAPMVVAESKVFCGGRLGNLTALDAATGEILWKVHHPGVESRPAPTYAEGKLLILRSRNNQGDSPYISGASGGPPGEGLWCHDAKTGKVLWHKPLTFKYHFNHDGLAVHEGVVFVEQIDKQKQVEAAGYDLATGKEIWRRSLESDLSPAPKSVVKLPPRFAGVMAGSLWCISVSERGTLALDPKTGSTVWSKKDLAIANRSRIGAREDVLVVFNEDGDHALDAQTGAPLWRGAAKASRYSQALTDRYMKSQGKDGFYPPAVCAWPIYVNGHWYSHFSFAATHGSNQLACLKEPMNGEIGLLNPKMVVWTYDFVSNACPAPSPAYGRLYYSPASEGVIYSFRPKE